VYAFSGTADADCWTIVRSVAHAAVKTARAITIARGVTDDIDTLSNPVDDSVRFVARTTPDNRTAFRIPFLTRRMARLFLHAGG
jgi:hypothetical protein